MKKQQHKMDYPVDDTQGQGFAVVYLRFKFQVRHSILWSMH